MKKESKIIKNRIFGALIALLIAFAAAGTATFAWYIYNTRAHTTNLQMAAGTYSSLRISDNYEGPYSTSINSFAVGELIPVSTNKIGIFQECLESRPGAEGEPLFVAYKFTSAKRVYYFLKTMYLKSGLDDLDAYIKMNYIDKEISGANSISTALRIGVVAYKPGSETEIDKELIFAINSDHNPNRQYNTEKGYDGCVLDSTKTDGSVVEFSPLTDKAYYKKNEETEEIDFTGATPICTCPGGSDGEGTPVKIDIYIWLEGCDPDCYGVLGELETLTFEFAGNNKT